MMTDTVEDALSRFWDDEGDGRALWTPAGLPQLKVGDRVRIRLSAECEYCFVEEAELDGRTGTIEAVHHEMGPRGDDSSDWRSHHYWVDFDEVPRGYMSTSHYAACELILLADEAARAGVE